MSKTDVSGSAAQQTARFLLDIKAVNFRPDEPYMLTAGWASPVYVDCRWVISFPEARTRIMELGMEMLQDRGALTDVNSVAGGETAGIPYAAWMAQSLNLPMQYVRKKPKGFGRNAQIEGSLEAGKKVLLVEDMATDGGSKINFVNALRQAGADVSDIFVVFFYGAFPDALDTLEKAGVRLHYLATWQDVLDVARAENYFGNATCQAVDEFLKNPVDWSKAHGGRG